MKRFALRFSLFLVVSNLLPMASVGQEQQKGCEFNIVGTWQSSTGGQMSPLRQRFGSNGVMTELSRDSSGKGSEWQATGKFTYRLDNPKTPKAMMVTPVDKSGRFSASAPLQIKTFDNGLFVTAPSADPGATLTRWTRVDPRRYFVVLAAGKGDPGFGGPGFAMLIKTDGVRTQTNAFGTYPVVNPLQRYPILGVIPRKIREQFHNEPAGDSGAMLRLEVTAGPYNRALEVLKTWERRAEEDTLLYTTPYLNNAVYLNQLVSSLNETGVLTWRGGMPCTDTIKLQKLTWLLSDPIMTQHNLTQSPYYLFKALRRLNGSLHLDDRKFGAALAGDQSTAVAISQR
ncbi:MAG TPA: hypothetical protein VFF50_00815 [Candidatus Deferrimicrobiaceae bacterium]|nr:hypothetical protein [Candidatus Deferrimicrobiaceae bacterium]